MPLPIVRLVLVCKETDFAHKAMEFAYLSHLRGSMELNLDLMFTKYQADLCCLANQNKPDNGQWHRVSHPVLKYHTCLRALLLLTNIFRSWSEIPS